MVTIKSRTRRIADKYSWVLLLLAIGLFLSLTITRLTRSSYWFDEAYSAYLIKFDFKDIIHYTSLDVHPPLYYFMLKIWSLIFGNNVISLRSLSIVFGVLTLLAVYRLARKVTGRRDTAGLTALLLAINPVFVRYGIEARMYMVMCLIAVLSTGVLIDLARRPNLKKRLAYAVLLAVGMYTHYFLSLVFAAQLIYLICRGVKQKNLFLKTIILWLITYLAAVILYLPWLPSALHQVKAVSMGFWVPDISAASPLDFITNFLFNSDASEVTGWLIVPFLATAISFGAVAMKAKNFHQSKLMLMMILLPIVFLLLMSMPPRESVFLARYLMPSMICLTIVLASLITSDGDVRWQLTLLTSVIICFSCGIVRVYKVGNYNPYGVGVSKISMEGEVMEQIEQSEAAPVIDEGIIAEDGEEYYEHYYEAATWEDKNHPVHFEMKNAKVQGFGSMTMMTDNKFGRGINNLNKFLKGHDKIWILQANNKTDAPKPKAMKNWRKVKTVSAVDPLSGMRLYKATLYQR